MKFLSYSTRIFFLAFNLAAAVFGFVTGEWCQAVMNFTLAAVFAHDLYQRHRMARITREVQASLKAHTERMEADIAEYLARTEADLIATLITKGGR